MSKTTETSKFAQAKLENRVLADSELDAVRGGASGQHIDDAIIETFDGGGGSGTTPAGAWNACLKVFGYGPQA